MKLPAGLPAVLALFLGARAAIGLGEASRVTTNPVSGAFALAQNGAAATIYVDSNDFWGVIRAAGDLQTDIHRVTGITPAITHDADKSSFNAIIIGSIGHSRLIDQLVRDHKIDVTAINGEWESFTRQVVLNPAPGIASALVIAGSDKRGTVYGIYDLSEQIGVSPWYWWADVPVKHSAALFIRPDSFVCGPPAVKYRGIFLNDEAPDLTEWVKQRFGDYNHRFYTNIFELLLRLRANYLWPAMWNNCFNEDDPENRRLADAYGIVMGTSHVEPMMRADKEWNRLGFTAAQWNYDKNPEELRKFWTDGIQRNKPYENIITIAMRGKIDTPMSESANIALLEKIVADQRRIITGVTGAKVTSVPQLWALYKEVQEYYEKGMRVPDDVTLLWCDDNWGNIRRLPTPEERHRSGGAGIYYHFDYVGGPRNYKWLNSNPLPKIWEQMNLAYDYGADRIWIVNVGHLHHVMFPTEFFLTLAWNPTAWPKERVAEFTHLWAAREFGPEHAAAIADIVAKYSKWNGRRKHELLSPDTFSLTNYNEASNIVADWKALEQQAEQLNGELPENARDAFYELVLNQVKASANLNELYVAAAKNHYFAHQHDPGANYWAVQTRAFFKTDTELSDYFNHTLAGGNWNHMMDQTHIGYTYWQQPPANKMPAVDEIEGPASSPTEPTPSSWPPSPAPSSDLHGFAESNGYVSIEAEHYTRKSDSTFAHWDVIPDYGRTLSAMTIFPTTAASLLPPADAPTLEYQVYLFDTNKVEVQAIIAPTLNFVPGRGLRLAVSFDDDPPQVLDALAHNTLQDWEASVRDSARVLKSSHPIIRPGYHTLKIRMVDPGVVLEKILIDSGGLRPSYLGPPESYHQ